MMPDEEKTEKAESAVDRAEAAAEAVSTRAVALKKAGLPTAVILLVTIFSIPGAWEFFFNRTDEEAKVKAEVAYQLLKQQTEAMAKQIEKQDRQMEQLRDTVNALVMARMPIAAYAGAGVHEVPDAEPEVVPDPPAPPPELKPLPANLDGLAAQRME